MSLRLVLSPSPICAAFIVAAHGAAATAIFLAIGELAGALLGGMLLALGVAAAWSRALLRSPGSVRALEIGGSTLVLELASGKRIDALVPRRCYVSRLAVMLPLRRALLISADMLSPTDFRRLRVWALWQKLPAVAAKQLAA